MDNPYEQEQQKILSRIVTTLEKLNESMLALNHAVAVRLSPSLFSSLCPPTLGEGERADDAKRKILCNAWVLMTPDPKNKTTGNERLQFVRV